MSDYMTDYRSEIDMWADMWDEMQASGTLPQAQKPQPSPFAQEVLGTRAQDAYYDYLDSEENYNDTGAEDYNQEFEGAGEGLLQEDKIPNPVYPDSVGPDNKDPQAAWVNEGLLKEVESLKKRLFAVENRMARMGQGKTWTEKSVKDDGRSLMKEVQTLRGRIDKVSSQLGIKHEPSPWRIKRD
jgi:hypothetical protein